MTIPPDPSLGHTRVELFYMDGQPAWSCSCGATGYWQSGEDAALQSWRAHVELLTSERPTLEQAAAAVVRAAKP